LDGNFYGTAWAGGTYGYGTVFKLTAGGSLTGIHSFTKTDGANPACPLVQGADGNFYGTTKNGGTHGGWGTIFRMTPAGILTSLSSFANTNGAYPVAGLTQDTGGTFYGTTCAGGTCGAGTVFKLAPDGTFTSLFSFTGGNDGSNCSGGLLLASDGNLYGTTQYGGGYGLGTVFRISLDGTLATLVQFDGYQGANPGGTLIQGTDGNFYGITVNGGASGLGAIFRLSFTVVPLPLISISTQGTNIVLNWNGGQPPYSVQMATDLATPAWQTIAGPMTNTTLLVTPTNAAAFYRVGIGN
jgi:uncharacterized repeat protein (TIGR03803 family)